MRFVSNLILVASGTLLGSTAAIAQSGWVANPGTTESGGVVTLNSTGQPAGTS